MTADLSSARRIVIAAPNWLGDAVLGLPAMAAIRGAAAGAHLTVAAPASVAALFHEPTGVAPDAVVTLPSGRSEAVTVLAGGRFDLGILFPNSFGSAWRLRRAGIPQRWGYASSGRGWLLTKRSRRPARRRAHHMRDYYRALVEGLGVPVGDDPPRLGVSAQSAREADRELSGFADGQAPLVVIAPGAAYGQAKQWPPARMAELVARLVREAGARAVVVGAAHDRPAARAIESWLRAHAPEAVEQMLDLVGRTSLGALVGITARAGVFVSNDSGAMHVAAALGRPVVAIFGPTDERATGPIGAHHMITEPVFCRPCLLRDCPIDHRCMKRITVDRVAAAARASVEPVGP